MENYSYQSYPDSGDSSPRSREIDFDNPPTTIPWEDQNQNQQQNNYKAKFMCSYGGKIQPRTHDNQLSYVGGETKILAVDRNIKFNLMITKLCSLIEAHDVSFKYQLPGEDLDALISVTNDDDLDHMMHEYDRLYRASARPARMRLFLFVNDSVSAPSLTLPDPVKQTSSNVTNVDYLFGIEKTVNVTPLPAAVKFNEPVTEPVARLSEFHSRPGLNPSDRVVVSDPGVIHPLEIQRQLQRMQIAENEQASYRRKSEDNLVGNYPAGAGDYYVQKVPEKFPVANFAAAPQQNQQQQGYWQERSVSGEVYPPVASGGGDQPVYMVPAPGSYYHAPVMRPQATQGYYAVQRMPSDAYRETQVYGGAPPPKVPFSTGVSATYAPAQPVKGPAYAEGVSVVRSSGIPDNTANSYAQVAYDSASGRQVYYNAQGGVVHAPQYQGVAAPVTTDVKVMSKVSQGSV